ncbi:MAG: hypothetical protein EXR94_05730 [Gemmatimonadetes bacterium]|nr:hypothetical protein [Gemmatimonadota bacterium]
MTSAVAVASADHTELSHVLRSGAKLGAIQTILIAVFGLLQPRLSGPVELVVLGVILIVGIAATITLPGSWTRARTIEGIAGAAGIGLTATVVFLLADVAVLQPAGLYTNRWLEIGGGSNWWYHPVWWMVGTYMPWMGAWVLANQAAKSGPTNPIALVGGAIVVAAVVMAAAVVLKFPGASFGLGTFAVAVLPALAILVLISSFGARRP